MRRDRSCLTWFVRAWTKLNKQTDLSGVTSRRLADPATSLASNTVLRSSSFIDVVNIYDTSLDFFSQTTQFKNVFLHVSAVTLLYVKHLLSSDHGSFFFFFFFFCSWVSKTNRCAPSVSAPCVWFSMPDVHDRRILCNVPAFFSLFFSLIWQAVLHIWLTNTHILLHGVSAEPKPEPQLLIFTLFLCIVALQGQWWKIYERHRR